MGGKPCDSSKVDEKLVDEAKETIIFLHWGEEETSDTAAQYLP